MKWDKLHDEDVYYEFRGNSPDQLTPGRFYRGIVDGFADFGVFVTIGDSVTGLLHHSKIDRRPERLGWSVGEEVFVQVEDVQDNGNVDLGWSIRQSEDEFRGSRIDNPLTEEDGRSEPPRDQGAAGAIVEEAGPQIEVETPNDQPSIDDSSEGQGHNGHPGLQTTVHPDRQLARVGIDTLSDKIGKRVRLEGQITDIRQTSGPTVFELADETGVVDCAAFKEAGARAYPAIDVGAFVRLDGRIERHRDELQVETEELALLLPSDRTVVEERINDALTERARPDNVRLLADHEPIVAVHEHIREAATALRLAIIQARPVVIRHTATVDGYVAGAAIERALISFIQDQHNERDAVYHYVDRRPLNEEFYEVGAAMADVTSMLEDTDRFGSKVPLVVLVDFGSGGESLAGLNLLGLYGVDRIVVDTGSFDTDVLDNVDAIVNPWTVDDWTDVTTTAVAANIAAHVDPAVRDELLHLPSISYWETPPDVYVELAHNAGYNTESLRDRREAIALAAYYQHFDDKRQLIADLLFDGESAGELAAHVSEQFRIKLETAIETARSNREIRTVNDRSVIVVDIDAFVHRFDFPSPSVLIDAIHRKESDEATAQITIGIELDALHIRSTESLDVHALVAAIRDQVPDAAVSTIGGRIRFLAGKRSAVLEAAIDAVENGIV